MMNEPITWSGILARCRASIYACLCLAALAAGCSGANAPRAVKGSVKFADGTVPQGEVAVIRFDPAGNAQAKQERPASGSIQADGSFVLTTFQDGDGAVPGKYKVVLAVFKKHDKPESPVAKKYLKPDTSPLEATVEASGANVFDFVVDQK